jgi:serine/threonine protein phosphatase PrpC
MIHSYSLQGKRESNEDQHISLLNLDNTVKKLNPINLFGVFDGHGGKLVSKYLKDNLPKYFLVKHNNNIINDTIKMKSYINKVYDLIQDGLKKEHPRAVVRCGSTCCVGIHYKDSIGKNRLWIINVGDSRAVKCNKYNKAEQLSVDHKPNTPDEKKRIENLGGKLTYDGFDWRIKDLSLSRAFGDVDSEPFVTHNPDIFNYRLSVKDKFIVFACDGLWDVIKGQQVIDFINNLITSGEKCNYAKKLAEYAIQKGSLDNVTVLIYLLN